MYLLLCFIINECLIFFSSDDKEVNDLWLKHAQNTSILQHYSEAMYKLATEHWEKRVM